MHYYSDYCSNHKYIGISEKDSVQAQFIRATVWPEQTLHL